MLSVNALRGLLGLAALWGVAMGCGGDEAPPPGAGAGGHVAVDSGVDTAGPTGAGGMAEVDGSVGDDAAVGAPGLGGAPSPGAGGGGGAVGTGGSGDAGVPDLQPPPGAETSAVTCTPSGIKQLFVDAIAEAAWLNVDLTPAAGMRGIADALTRLRTEDRAHPVRLRLAPGFYPPTDPGQGELYIKNLQRSAAAPVLVQALDAAPNATRLGQGFTLVAVSYLAFDGVTIGPASTGAYHGGNFCVGSSCYHDEPKPLAAAAGFHVAGTAIAPEHAGQKDGHLDYAVFGRYAPAHHVVIRRVTIQNLFADDEPSGAMAAGAGSDGIKLNQAANVWVTESRIRQTSRHGIDNVGVHGGCFFGNTIADVGQGLGIEAKGGSIDVTYDSNTFMNVRRVELGGENTDATYYWSAETPGTPLHYGYEGRRIVARNNLVIDPRQGAFEFSGCHDCAAVNNTVLYRRGFDTGEGGGDVLREVDSVINREGAGSDCVPADGEVVDMCWQVGPYPADLVPMPGENGSSRVLTNARNVFGNNLLLSPEGLWGPELSPYNHPNPMHSRGLLTVDYNYWWNGALALVDPQDETWLMEGPHSVYTGPTANQAVGVDVTAAADASNPEAASGLRAALRPPAGSPVAGKGGAALGGYAAHDGNGQSRPAAPSIGALEP